jgi:hypothetical protein
VALRKITAGGLFIAAATLAVCSSSPSPQARATAEACDVLAGHAETKQIEMAATEGLISGNGELPPDATQLQKDLALASRKDDGVPALLDIDKMAGRRRQLGSRIAKGW